MQLILQTSVKGSFESDRIFFYHDAELFSLTFHLFMYLFIYLGQRDGFGTAAIITALLGSSWHMEVNGDPQLLLFIMVEQTV